MSPILDAILSGLDAAGYALDTPGALMRGVLAGRPGERMDGRGLLEEWGVLDENREGLDGGDVAGFAADMLLDPLNLLSGGAIGGLKLANRGIDAANASSRAMRAAGAMPEEVAALTRIGAEGTPQKMFHGVPSPGVEAKDLDPAASSFRDQWFGAGTYFTPHADRASQYARAIGDDGAMQHGSVAMAYLGSRNPFRAPAHPHDFDAAIEQLIGRTPESSRDATDALRGLGYDSVIAEGPFGMEEVVVFDKSQIYSPYVAPALQDRHDISPVLAAMIGNTALQAPYDIAGQTP